jgi:hypothetical protein
MRELAMYQSHLTRWIEDAEARRFSEAASIDRRWAMPTICNENFASPLTQFSSWLQAHVHYPRPWHHD